MARNKANGKKKRLTKDEYFALDKDLKTEQKLGI